MRNLVVIISSLLLFASCRKHDLPAPDGDKPDEPVSAWKLHTKLNSPLPDDQVNAITIDNNDVKWVGTANGLLRIRAGEWTVFNSAQLPSGYITAVGVDNSGTVWVGTNAGLASYNGSTWKTFTKENSVLGDNGIMCITNDSKKNVLWVATSKGFVKIQNNTWTYNDDIDHELILSMATDQQGALWLGTFNHTAFRGNIRRFDNAQWSGFSLANLGYASAFPYAIAVDKNDHVYAALAGTVAKAVIRYGDNNWQEIDRPENARGFNALALEEDKIWVGGQNLALMGDKSAETIAIPGTDSPIKCMAIDSKGSKWLGTIYGGLAVYSKK